MTTFDAFLRMHRQTRFCAILLAGLLGLVLAGCAGSSKDAASGGNPLAVTDVQSIVGDTNILLGWTNPNRDNITGFQITSQVVVNGSVDNETLVERLFTENIEERSLTDGPGFSINKSARVTYNITGLAEDTEYEVVIGVIYNEDTSDPQNLRLARMTTGDITTGIGNDFDRDGKKNREDDCPSGLTGTANATEDIDNDGCRNSEDPDTDGDGVLNDVDEFPLDACASVDADNDGRPDILVADCMTTLTVDDNVISSEPGGDPLAVTDVQSIVGDTNILLGWTNPNRGNITGFQITPHVVVDGSVDNESLAVPLLFTSGPGFSTAQDARVTYDIRGLAEDTEYEVVIGVIYHGNTSNPQNLRLARMTTGEPTTGIGTDLDRDGMPNPEDSCPLGVTGAANATADIDNDGCRNSEDPDIDGDDVLNDVDAFPLDACASVDADDDGLPDMLVLGCDTTLTVDPSPPSPPDLPPLTVLNLQAVSAGNNITVSWTNPARNDITGFRVSWVDDANPGDEISSMPLSNTSNPAVNIESAAGNTFTIVGLEYNANYTITVTVFYGDELSAAATTSAMIGMDPDVSGGDNRDPLPPVSNLAAALAPAGNAIIVSWDNPVWEDNDILGFRVDWVNVDDVSDAGTLGFGDTEVNISSGALDNTGTTPEVLEFDATYDITVAVVYDGVDGPVTVVSDPISAKTAGDTDDDGVADPNDADYDNDGLIEIYTFEDLNDLNNDLEGNGTDGDMGCPDTGCIGYELMRSLNFAEPDSYENSANLGIWRGTFGDAGWPSIGSCEDVSGDTICTPYSGVFDGNHNNISDMRIYWISPQNGVGLFGAFNGSIRNLGLLNAYVEVADGVVASNIGLLVGHGQGGTYKGLSVTGTVLATESTNVGGLIGFGDSANIVSSYANIESVSGGSQVGGLVGRGDLAEISHSYAIGGKVNATSDTLDEATAGGLIGIGAAQIDYSYAAVGTVSGGHFVGGLIGANGGGNVVASYWDNQTTGVSVDANAESGSGNTTSVLRTPARIDDDNRGFAGTIYEAWGDFVCDPNTGDVRAGDLSGEFTQYVWDLGTSEQYPALNCVPGGLEAQRPTTP